MNRIDIINALLARVEAKVTHYLEIGIAGAQALKEIKAAVRIGVDPHGYASTCPMTSDEFFTLVSPMGHIQFDVIFIDGDHTDEQAWKDMLSAAKRLKPGGYIVMHDCNPLIWQDALDEPFVPVEQGGRWNGTVWWAVAHGFQSSTFTGYTVETDEGCAVIQPVPGKRLRGKLPERPAFDELDENRDEWLHRLLRWSCHSGTACQRDLTNQPTPSSGHSVRQWRGANDNWS